MGPEEQETGGEEVRVESEPVLTLGEDSGLVLRVDLGGG